MGMLLPSVSRNSLLVKKYLYNSNISFILNQRCKKTRYASKAMRPKEKGFGKYKGDRVEL